MSLIIKQTKNLTAIFHPTSDYGHFDIYWKRILTVRIKIIGRGVSPLITLQNGNKPEIKRCLDYVASYLIHEKRIYSAFNYSLLPSVISSC